VDCKFRSKNLWKKVKFTHFHLLRKSIQDLKNMQCVQQRTHVLYVCD
jgi:hypothetical protein